MRWRHCPEKPVFQLFGFARETNLKSINLLTKDDQKKASALGSDLSSDHSSVKRCSTMFSGGGRKKSIIGGLEVNRFKSFKNLVATKILSKSDRSLETVERNGERPTVAGLNVNGKPNPIVTSTVLTARDNFMRRSSRTSFTEIEVSTAAVILTVVPKLGVFTPQKSFDFQKKGVAT